MEDALSEYEGIGKAEVGRCVELGIPLEKGMVCFYQIVNYILEVGKPTAEGNYVIEKEGVVFKCVGTLENFKKVESKEIVKYRKKNGKVEYAMYKDQKKEIDKIEEKREKTQEEKEKEEKEKQEAEMKALKEFQEKLEIEGKYAMSWKMLREILFEDKYTKYEEEKMGLIVIILTKLWHAQWEFPNGFAYADGLVDCGEFKLPLNFVPYELKQTNLGVKGYETKNKKKIVAKDDEADQDYVMGWIKDSIVMDKVPLTQLSPFFLRSLLLRLDQNIGEMKGGKSMQEQLKGVFNGQSKDGNL